MGEAVELKCDALSNKTVQWSKDGVVLQSKTTGYGTSLLIGSVKYSDEGMYTCEVINKAGAIDASYNEAVRVNGQYVHTEQFSPYLHSSEEKVQIGIRKFSKMDDSMLVDNAACFLFEQEGNTVVSLRRSAALDFKSNTNYCDFILFCFSFEHQLTFYVRLVILGDDNRT